MSFWRNLLNLICTKYLKQISLKLSPLGYLTEKCKDFFANTVDFYRYDLQIYLSLLLKGQLPRTQESWSPERNCSEHHGERSLKLFNCIMKVCFYWQKQPKQWMPRTVTRIGIWPARLTSSYYFHSLRKFVEISRKFCILTWLNRCAE